MTLQESERREHPGDRLKAPAIDSSFCVLAVYADARDFRLDMAQRLTERLAARSRPRALAVANDNIAYCAGPYSGQSP